MDIAPEENGKKAPTMAFTSDGKRNYKCRRCGKWTVEDLKQWNSKPQQKKNICPVCVEKVKQKQLELIRDSKENTNNG